MYVLCTPVGSESQASSIDSELSEVHDPTPFDDALLDELLHSSELDDSLHMDDLIVGRTLGVGTFGKVVFVKHKDTGACYALKILKKHTVRAF